MGGDYAPAEVVKGAIQAAKELDVEILLVGLRKEVEQEVNKIGIAGLPVSVVEATDIIREGEQPAIAVMKRPNSSMPVAARLVKEGKADAFVSAGSTGGMMVSSLQFLGTLPGIERPVAGGPFLGLAPNTVVLDLGANVGCKGYQLLNFAVIGTVYVKTFMGIQNPTVGILSVGAEEGKGNDLVKETFPLLKKSGLNFIGNVEGMDIVFGKANVIVCDGFVGNILIKFSEGMGKAIGDWLTKEMEGKLSEADMQTLASRLRRTVGIAMEAGGGPLWGVNGIACVAHGASKAPQVFGTIKQAKLAVESGFVPTLRAELEKAQKSIAS
jgi:glycerol-3-phosphate acyltransferase PlsX